MPITAGKIVRLIAKIAEDKKAEEIVILKVKDICLFTDYFVICSGSSNRQVKTIADTIIKKLKEKKVKLDHIEGYKEGRWILLDYGDIIVHIFYEESRKFYNLERLWKDAKRI